MKKLTSAARRRVVGHLDAPSPGGPEPARHRDRGFSLVEVVITVALLGIAVIPIMSSVFASIRTSSVARSAAQVETAVVNAADRVNRAPRTCDYTPYVQAAVQTQGWDPSTASVVHERLQTPTDATATAVWVPGACLNDPILTDLEVQRVTISISSPDGRVTRSIQVVKSDV